MIGGMLAQPAERFPFLFGDNVFLKQYPYFLPCAIAATISLIAWLVAFLFLKETHPAPISLGRLVAITTKRKNSTSQNENLENDVSQAERPLPLRSLLTPQVLIAAGNYASLCLVDIAFKAIQPVFLSTPIDLGGLGLPPPTIGTLLSVQGVSYGIFQVFFFARIHDRWGSKKVFIAGISGAIPAFLVFPIVNALARTQGYSIAVWVAIGFQVIATILLGSCYGQFPSHFN